MMLPMLSSAFMTATRMDGFSYIEMPRQPRSQIGAGLARALRALFGLAHPAA